MKLPSNYHNDFLKITPVLFNDDNILLFSNKHLFLCSFQLVFGLTSVDDTILITS